MLGTHTPHLSTCDGLPIQTSISRGRALWCAQIWFMAATWINPSLECGIWKTSWSWGCCADHGLYAVSRQTITQVVQEHWMQLPCHQHHCSRLTSLNLESAPIRNPELDIRSLGPQHRCLWTSYVWRSRLVDRNCCVHFDQVIESACYDHSFSGSGLLLVAISSSRAAEQAKEAERKHRRGGEIRGKQQEL